MGNKFLDDLRHADVLLHILDISGTTNEKVVLVTTGHVSEDVENLVELVGRSYYWI